MSACCILTPIVVAAWPAFSAAVAAAATSLGYSVVADTVERATREEKAASQTKVELEIANSELVTGQLGRDQRITVTRGGVTVTFSRDARGRAKICVDGAGHTDEALRAFGEELSKSVVQRYVYQRVMDELRSHQFSVVEDEQDEDGAIRLKVRRWDN